MSTQRPSAERLRQLLNYEPETGVLRWKLRGDPQWDGKWAGKRAGAITRDGYRTITIENRHYRAARVIWAWATGEWPSPHIDHRSRDQSDDTWDNLRLATDSQNAANQKTRCDNLVGIRGVRRLKNGYAARIMRDGREMHLGLFETPEAAQMAYQKAASELFGEYAQVPLVAIARKDAPVQPATVGVPVSVPVRRKFRAAQVATEPNFVVLEGTCPVLAGLVAALA